MVELDFSAEGARFEPYSVSPLMLFGLRVTNKTPALGVQNVSLQCQIRIEPTRRLYGGEEHDRLVDLFGEPERWGQTLHSFLWTHASVSVPPFETECRIDLPVPCSSDFNIAATKYFYGLQNGEAPLSLLFSGTVFYRAEDGRLQIEQISWTKEATYRLPVGAWQAMMDHYYPDSAWLLLERDVFERLYAYKRRNGLPSWEHAVRTLLDSQPAGSLR
jgi:hypothetical protein